MRIALTGATGFVGRHLAARLISDGHTLRCWRRPTSDTTGLPDAIEWVEGGLHDPASVGPLLDRCDALIHAAMHKSGDFQSPPASLAQYAELNVLGSLRLFEAAAERGPLRTVYLSSGGVHDVVLEDRPLDESHPLWPMSLYGAHKAALEAFVSALGRGQRVPICVVRSCAVYGLAYRPPASRWFGLVGCVARGERVELKGGRKVVHAADVAAACSLLLHADRDAIVGEVFNCCDRYVSRHEVATIARELSGSDAEIVGEPSEPKHTIETGKLTSLGMRFGGTERLRATIAELLAAQ